MSHPRSSNIRLATVVLAGCCAALLSPAGAGAAGPSQPLAAASAPRCVTSRLVVSLDSRGSGAAGSTYYRLKLTNVSGHTCSLAGFPGVSGVGIVGRQIGSSARDHAGSASPITLRNHATATAILRIVDVGNYPQARCHRVMAAGLRVYPPNQKVSKVVPFPFRARAGALAI